MPPHRHTMLPVLWKHGDIYGGKYTNFSNSDTKEEGMRTVSWEFGMVVGGKGDKAGDEDGGPWGQP